MTSNNNKDLNSNIVECPACSVKIDLDTDRVLFSFGKPGTRSKLYTRVCQYAKNKQDCINKGDHCIRDGDKYLKNDEYIEQFSLSKYGSLVKEIKEGI